MCIVNIQDAISIVLIAVHSSEVNLQIESSTLLTFMCHDQFLTFMLYRLSRPSLAQQHTISKNDIANIPASSILAQSNLIDDDFILSPSLTLPPAFGSAYVGESFSCSLCANNEQPDDSAKTINGVHITAEMQTPSQQSVSLSLSETEHSGTLAPGASLPQIVRYDLKEEGVHVLAVNLTYTEITTNSPAERVRTFRKLYQFQAQPCLSVRTKATDLTPKEVPDKSLGPYGRSFLTRFVLEAQLENVAEGNIVLEKAELLAYPPFKAKSMNWDSDLGKAEDNPLLIPRDVLQLAFVIEQDADVPEGVDELKVNMKRDGRTNLGQIALEWRSSMGEKGQLTTGSLFSKKRTQ